MSIIISSLWVQWIELVIGKSIVILYQYGFYTIDERVFATIFINDYEKKSRTWIPILIVTVIHFLSIPTSYIMIENMTTIEIALIGMFLISTGFSTGFLFVLKFNRRIEFKKTLTLSQKFQVKENIRAISILRTFVLVVAAYMVLICFIVTLLYLKIVQGAVLDHLVDNLISLNPIVCSLVLMSCSKVWSRKFFPAKYFHREIDTSIVMIDDTAVYFNQLKNAWI
ncbi:unnamed protein product [Caenorhabditis angaria]|uniref:Uncharacterized protein n=1 Tax=Caenorhabditis angaria TaxID=860376 RepID=A0A9P1IDG4_9PELO|nr:unnamed protein product [Caenorhabditis angaria]